MKADDVLIHSIFNSRGEETVCIELHARGRKFMSSAPSGKSMGSTEVPSFPGGVKRCMDNFGRLKAKLMPKDMKRYDAFLGEHIAEIGGSAALAASACAYKALGPKEKNVFPFPVGVVFSGGMHASGPTIQEFLSIPVGAETMYDAVRANIAVHRKVDEILDAMGRFHCRYDEGGWVSPLNDEEAFDVVSKAVDHVSKELFEVRLGADLAASTFFRDGKYCWKDRHLAPAQHLEKVIKLAEEHNLYMLEDPANEDDFAGFAEVTSEIGKRCLVVGDDLYTTRRDRVEMGVLKKSTNAVLVKPNQIGLVSKALDVIDFANKNSIVPVISHRSGETNDPLIAKIALEKSVPFIKTGVMGGERMAKLNYLLLAWDRCDCPEMASIRR